MESSTKAAQAVVCVLSAVVVFRWLAAPASAALCDCPGRCIVVVDAIFDAVGLCTAAFSVLAGFVRRVSAATWTVAHCFASGERSHR